MDYQFGRIEELIRKSIELSGRATKVALSQLKINSGQVKIEVEIQKKSFAYKILPLETSKAIERFVRFHQMALTFMLNNLFNIICRIAPLGPTLVPSEKSIYDDVEKLLLFLATEYAPHFDMSAQIPEGSIQEMETLVKTSINYISSALVNREIETVLLNLCTTLPGLILSQYHIISLETSSKVKTYIAKIRQAIDSAIKGDDLEKNIRSIIIECDVNVSQAYSYLVGKMESNVIIIESDADKLQYLRLQEKLIRQAGGYSEPRLEYKEGSLAHRLIEWIHDELTFIKNSAPIKRIGLPTDEDFADFKIPLNMSVSQLACLIRSLVESGIIHNTNTSELLRFLATYVSTKKSGTISAESLRIKYYNIERNTKEAVREILHNSIRTLNSH